MKVAIVGCGQIADVHIQEVQKIPGAVVEAVCDLQIHMAKQAATRFNIPGIYANLDDMLQEVRPDVVHITTPPVAHLSLGKKILASGAHIYVEKPFTVNAAEAEELLHAARRAGKLVCVGHNSIFDRVFLAVKNMHQEGLLGRIVHVDAVMGNDLRGEFSSVFMADPTAWVHQLPGGIAQNNISHPLSMILEFLKDEKPAIDAHGFRWRKTKYGDIRDRFFDELRVLLLGQETTAHMIFSCFSRPIQRYVVIYGTKGQVTASLDAQTVRWITPTSVPNPFKKILLASRDMRQAGQDSLRHLRDLLKGRLHTFESMNTLFHRFYLAIEGQGEVPIHKSEIIRLTSIMDAIFEQCHEHAPEPGAMETFV